MRWSRRRDPTTLVLPVILHEVKTAISIPDHLYLEAEALAMRLGFNRSQLYVKALEEFVANQEDDSVTAKLDEIASAFDTATDPALDGHGRTLIDAGSWVW